MKTIIRAEEIKEIRDRLREINKLDLMDITFTENGKPIEVEKSLLDKFKFTGLNNTDFIDSEFYLDGKFVFKT